MTAYSQDDRPLRISSRLGDRVVAGELRALERTSVPFELEIRVFSEEPALPVESLVSDAVVIALENHPGQVRYFHGIVNGVSDAGEEGGLYAYDLHAVPWFWFLSLRSDCRIFAGKSVPEIVEEVLRTDSRIRFRSALTRSYEKREYSVQYRETDLAFVSRLLEDEGIAYHFEFTEQGHTLVLWDSPGAVEECLFRPDAAYDPAPSAADAGDCVRQLVYKTAARSRAVELADYDFERPRELLRAAVGATPEAQIFDYPGNFLKYSQGEARSRMALEREAAAASFYDGTGGCPGFTAGHRFELREHFRLGFNQKYRLLEVEHRASYGGFRSRTSDESYRYSNRFRATPAAMAYRPPCATPKPVVRGAQTAVVVGRPGEEIRPDRYGRIKVRFHWDRLARADESGSCSCWLRVSETWAGQNWGSLSLPRVGQEVIVDFLEGDPDRPIITGRVYNSSQMPGWPLPAAQTVSGVRTHSSLEGSGANYNEISVDDKKGAEVLAVHAERDRNESVEHDSEEEVGHDRQLLVRHDQVERVDGDLHASVRGERREKVEESFSLTVQGGHHLLARTSHAGEAGQEIHLRGGARVVVEAGARLTLKGPGGYIDIGPGGVTIRGTMVRVNSGGAAAPGATARPDEPVLPGRLATVRTGAGGRGTRQAATMTAARKLGVPFTRMNCDRK